MKNCWIVERSYFDTFGELESVKYLIEVEKRFLWIFTYSEFLRAKAKLFSIGPIVQFNTQKSAEKFLAKYKESNGKLILGGHYDEIVFSVEY